jgi:hypothetical protein
MVDERYPGRRSRGLLTPVLGGILLIAALVAAIAFRSELWDFLTWIGRLVRTWLTDWVPAHRGQTGAIIGFAVLAFILNWIAHVRGRLRAWIFALVVEAGLWILFWYGIGIAPLNELTGLRIPRMEPATAAISGGLVVAIIGAVFWFLELREEWRKYRRRHHVDED